MDKPKPWLLTEIQDPIQCRQVTMPDTTDTSSKVCYVMYFKLMIFYQDIFCYEILKPMHLNLGRPTPIYKFGCWHIGTWVKWCAEAVEVGP